MSVIGVRAKKFKKVVKVDFNFKQFWFPWLVCLIFDINLECLKRVICEKRNRLLRFS